MNTIPEAFATAASSARPAGRWHQAAPAGTAGVPSVGATSAACSARPSAPARLVRGQRRRGGRSTRPRGSTTGGAASTATPAVELAGSEARSPPGRRAARRWRSGARRATARRGQGACAPAGGPVSDLRLAGSGLGDGLVGFQQGDAEPADRRRHGRRAAARLRGAARRRWVRSQTGAAHWDAAPNALSAVRYARDGRRADSRRNFARSSCALRTRELRTAVTRCVVATDAAASQETDSGGSRARLDTPRAARARPAPRRRRPGRVLDGTGPRASGVARRVADHLRRRQARARQGARPAPLQRPGTYRLVVKARDKAGNRRVRQATGERQMRLLACELASSWRCCSLCPRSARRLGRNGAEIVSGSLERLEQGDADHAVRRRSRTTAVTSSSRRAPATSSPRRPDPPGHSAGRHLPQRPGDRRARARGRRRPALHGRRTRSRRAAPGIRPSAPTGATSLLDRPAAGARRHNTQHRRLRARHVHADRRRRAPSSSSPRGTAGRAGAPTASRAVPARRRHARASRSAPMARRWSSAPRRLRPPRAAARGDRAVRLFVRDRSAKTTTLVTLATGSRRAGWRPAAPTGRRDQQRRHNGRLDGANAFITPDASQTCFMAGEFPDHRPSTSGGGSPTARRPHPPHHGPARPRRPGPARRARSFPSDPATPAPVTAPWPGRRGCPLQSAGIAAASQRRRYPVAFLAGAGPAPEQPAPAQQQRPLRHRHASGMTRKAGTLELTREDRRDRHRPRSIRRRDVRRRPFLGDHDATDVHAFLPGLSTPPAVDTLRDLPPRPHRRWRSSARPRL